MSPRRPLLGVAILYAVGIGVGSVFSVPLAILFGLSACFLAAFFLFRRHLGFLYATIFVGGMLSYALATFTPPLHLKNQIGERRVNVLLRGVVVGIPVFEERPDSTVLSGRSKVELRVSAWEETDKWMRAEGKVMVLLPIEKEEEPPEYGDELEMRGVVERPEPPMNFGQFDYRKELERQRIFYLVHVQKPDDVKVVARRRGNPLMSAALDSRDYLRRALHCGIEEETEVTHLLDAMLLGYRQTTLTKRGSIPFSEQFKSFQASGVAHLFAINGLHVGLVAAVLMILLTACSVPRLARLIIVILLLAFYTLVTGVRPGAVRALIMASVLLAGFGFKRPADTLNSIGAAGLIILLIHPLDLLGSGFQLSFVVVTSIVMLAQPMREWLRQRFEPDPWIPSRCVPAWRDRMQGPIFYGTSLVGASAAACIGTLPLMALYYNLFAPVALLANLLVIPALTLIVALGALSIGSYFIWPWLAAAWNNASWLVIKGLVAFIGFCVRFPGSHQYVAAPSLGVIWLYYAIALLAVSGWLWKASWRWIAVGTVGVVIGLWTLANSVFDNSVRVTVLHSNGGQAIHIAPSYQDGLLIDGGPEPEGKYIVVPFLHSRGIDQLDGVMMSHGDASFLGGLKPVFEQIPVATVFDTDAPTRSLIHRELRKLVAERKIERHTAEQGFSLPNRHGLEIRILHPVPGHYSHLADDNSIVLLLISKDQRLLFTASAGETVERELLARGDDLRADIVIKGRHERETSCTDEFLDRVQPQVVIFSAGDYPPSAYPQPEILERLARRDIRVYRTDRNGAVQISIAQGRWTLETFSSHQSARSGEVLPPGDGQSRE